MSHTLLILIGLLIVQLGGCAYISKATLNEIIVFFLK